MRLSVVFFGVCLGLSDLAGCGSFDTTQVAAARQRTIITVWDGLRPDAVNPVDTPNLYALGQQGVQFVDNHATYPTFTMMNGSSFATGSFPKTSGFYGNTF
jgi:predicted AlkP superfamily pyrophosphatase or phosphodiesterase